MAHQNWPDQNPLGKHIQLGRPEAAQPFRTLLGVVGDVQPIPLDHDPAPTAYVPFAHQPESDFRIRGRERREIPLNSCRPINVQLHALTGTNPRYDIRSLKQVVSTVSAAWSRRSIC